MTRSRISARVIALVLVLQLAVPMNLFARTQLKRGTNMYSIEQDVELGRQASAEADRMFPLVNDPQVTSYINRLGQRLAQYAPGNEFQYTFKVVAQKEINAFALPGGPIYINVGTITAARNESELAGVIGHEIGHIVMRHSTNQATKAGILQGLAGLIGGRSGSGIGGQLAQVGIMMGAGSVLMKYSRDAERQSDILGAQMLWDAGINPTGMVSFFETLAAESGRRGSDFFSSHPNPGNRASAVAKEVSSLGRKSFSRDSTEFQNIKRRAASLKQYTAEEIAQMQKSGGVNNSGVGSGGTNTGNTPTGPIQRSGSIMPSGRFRNLDSQVLSMSYPDNWNASEGQGGLTIAPPGGANQQGIAYGVIVGGAQGQQGASLNDQAIALLNNIKQQNPGMQESSSWSNTTVSGRAARAVTLRGTSPLQTNGQAEQEKDWFVVTQRSDGTLIYFVFVAPVNDFNELEPTYSRMLRSIQIK